MKRRLITAAGPILVAGLILGALVRRPALAAADKADTAVGRKLFVQYCAPCHGIDGKGTGPVAPSLKTPPADLTRIEKVDGKFPSAHVEVVIDGERMSSAHGTREMPVWGAYLRRVKGDGFAKLDLYNLTKYIESIQETR